MKVTLSRDLTILFTLLAMVTHSSAADVMLGEDEPVSDYKGDFVQDPTTSKTTGLQTDETSELITTGSPNMAPSPPKRRHAKGSAKGSSKGCKGSKGSSPICQCCDNPFAYRFTFVGGTCEDSVNSQKFWCSDYLKVQELSHIEVTNAESDETYYEGNVNQGQFFEINADRDTFDGNTLRFKISVKEDPNPSEWILAQLVYFDTSCDSPLYLGDRFGDIVVTGWANEKQGVVVEGGTNKC